MLPVWPVACLQQAPVMCGTTSFGKPRRGGQADPRLIHGLDTPDPAGYTWRCWAMEFAPEPPASSGLMTPTVVAGGGSFCFVRVLTDGAPYRYGRRPVRCGEEPAMRLLVISDLHANWPALEAVLAAEPHDHLPVVGDLVSYGPHAREVVECVRQQATLAVRGNHDEALAHQAKVPGSSSSLISRSSDPERSARRSASGRPMIGRWLSRSASASRSLCATR
jgi:Calcineurin-like phosphoesterase superfamily domain